MAGSSVTSRGYRTPLLGGLRCFHTPKEEGENGSVRAPTEWSATTGPVVEMPMSGAGTCPGVGLGFNLTPAPCTCLSCVHR